MTKAPSPLKVLLMDDDFHALKWNTAIIMRDPRSTVVGETESPDELLAYLDNDKEEKADVIMLDVEYHADFPSIDALLSTVRKTAPDAILICLSQYGRPEAIQAAVKHKVSGFLIKNEVKMAVVPAIAQAVNTDDFVISPSVEEKVREVDSYLKTHTIPVWKPNPGLTPQIMKSFWLRVFFGMRASLAAEELYVETATVERYINQAYKILPDTWADERYLFGVDFEDVSPEDQAFVWFTLPPNK